MFTEPTFAALHDYDFVTNAEAVDLKKYTPVKQLTVIDFSDNAIYYRDAFGVLVSVERKLVKNKIRLAIGEVIVFNASMDVVSIGSKSIDELAVKSSSRSGQAATAGSNETKLSSIL